VRVADPRPDAHGTASPGILQGAQFTLAAQFSLSTELERWRRAGARPRLWWRDDDARTPSAALDRLLAMSAGRPLALAVIPDGDLAALAERLRSEPGVTIGQHGVDHQNRRDSAPPSEYPAPPTIAALQASISGGQGRLQAAGLSPAFYTPPWNAVDPALPDALAHLGVPILSAGRAPIAHAGVQCLSAEIDILSWKHGPRFKGARRILSALRRALVDRRAARALGRPIGLLTHHLVHDAAAWRFLGHALPWLDRRFDWVSVDGSDAKAGRSPMARHREEMEFTTKSAKTLRAGLRAPW
jgi:peptidoglycan/xylan/chitin deacetylase (PgdA/CDA1 family)